MWVQYRDLVYRIHARQSMFTRSISDECVEHIVWSQVVLCEAEMGTIVVQSGTDEAPQEQKITFQIIDGELVDMDNPHGFPLHVEVVI